MIERIDSMQEYTDESLRATLEALLLVCDDALDEDTIAELCELSPEVVHQALCSLRDAYIQEQRGFQCMEVQGGWRLATHPDYAELVSELVVSWDKRRISQAGLETLAIIAYLQPTTREAVRGLRGVNSDSTIHSLIERGLIKETRAKKGSHQVYLSCTKKFLDHFGLGDFSELPPLDDFAPDEKTRTYIRERLQIHQNTAPVSDVVEAKESETTTHEELPDE